MDFDIQEAFRRYAAIWCPPGIPAEQPCAAMAGQMPCTEGQKGRFKASKREFVIVKTTPQTSTIRFRFERDEIEFQDSELKAECEPIDVFSEPK